MITLDDIEKSASTRLTTSQWDYFAGGADDEITLRRNNEAFNELELLPKVLVGVGECDTRTTVLGQKTKSPILVAPTAYQRLAHPDGEIATARATRKAGSVMVLSSASNAPVEDVVREAGGDVWFQLYVYPDRGLAAEFVQRVVAAGCKAIVVTVDAPVYGRRNRDLINKFSLPDEVVNNNNFVPGLAADPRLTWEDLDWLRGVTDLPIVLKGILRDDDAKRAVELGVDAIGVSNHGGRQLDSTPATIDVLRSIADTVAGAAEIYLDGGIRRGTDVIKAMALGANAVLIGRPVLWGLIVNGQAGVDRVFEILSSELERAMALCGCPTLEAITTDMVRYRRR